MGNAIAADKSYCSRGAKSIVAQNSLLIERSRCGRRPGVCVVVHHLVAQRRNRKRVTGRAHVRSNSIAIHFFDGGRSEEHTSELQSLTNLVCRLLLEKKRTQPSASRQPASSEPTDSADALSSVRRRAEVDVLWR